MNGAKKLENSSSALEVLYSADVNGLQETFLLPDDDGLELEGYASYHSRGFRANGRPRWGVSSYFRLSSFSDGSLHEVISPLAWVVVVRWLPKGWCLRHLELLQRL